MAKQDDKLPIHIIIGRQDLYFSVPRDQEEDYRKAARIINERLSYYEESYRGQAFEKYMAITVLDFVITNLRLQTSKDVEPVLESIKQITTKIHDQLKES